ncbi:hypothetical protein JHK82_050485 [Glycine max]|nr:hypothetical protein JHK82_050485 [Glycine max]
MRNEKVWNHAELPIPYTLQSAMQSIREWQRARIAPLSANVFSIAQHDTRWYSPPIGCCRDDRSFSQPYNTSRAEAMALYKAILWVADLHFDNIIFESDCKHVIDSLLAVVLRGSIREEKRSLRRFARPPSRSAP